MRALCNQTGPVGDLTPLPRPLAALRALPDKAFSVQKCTKCRLAAGLRPNPLWELTALPRPLAALRAFPDKAFSDQKCTKCRLAARLCPDPLGELERYPRPSSCIETPRTFGARSSAPRLTPSAFGDRAFRFFFFLIRTLRKTFVNNATVRLIETPRAAAFECPTQ